MISNSAMQPGPAAGAVAPAIMRIGAARMTAGLDRYPRLDLEAHRDLFGRLPRLSDAELISMAQQVDLRGHGGAAFPSARKLQAVVDAARKSGQPTIVVVNATEGEPGSFKDKMLLMRSPYLVLSGAALAAEAIGAEEIIVGVAGNELANRSLEAAIAAEPGLRYLVRIVEVPDRFISGESGALIRGINGKSPSRRAVRRSRPKRCVRPANPAVQRRDLRAARRARPARRALRVGRHAGGTRHRPAQRERLRRPPRGRRGAHRRAARFRARFCQAPAGDGVLVGGYHGMWLPAENAYVVPLSRGGLEAVGGTLGAGIVLPLGDGPARSARCPGSRLSRRGIRRAVRAVQLALPRIARALAALIDGSGGIEALDVARRSAASVSGRGACAHPDGMTRFALSALDIFTEDLAPHVFHSSCGRPVRGSCRCPRGRSAAHSVCRRLDAGEGHGLCADLVSESSTSTVTSSRSCSTVPVPD